MAFQVGDALTFMLKDATQKDGEARPTGVVVTDDYGGGLYRVLTPMGVSMAVNEAELLPVTSNLRPQVEQDVATIVGGLRGGGQKPFIVEA